MAIILPILLFLFLELIFLDALRGISDAPRREAAIGAALVFGLIVTASTEILSIAHCFRVEGVFATWILAALCAVVYAFRHHLFVRPGNDSFLISNPVFEKFLLACAILYSIVLGATAFLAHPNTYDSMTYHLPRVMHWIQNHAVQHYQTAITRQLFMAPWTEFTQAHLILLSGSDRAANFVQFGSMLGSLIAVSLIAAELGGDRRQQALAAIFVLTLPMGLLQATSTQNDYAAGFWMSCTVFYLIRFFRKGHAYYGLAAGTALGLVLLTKSTGYIFAFPFVAFFFLASVNVRRIPWKLIMPIVLLPLIINSGYYARNIQLTGNPLMDPAEKKDYSNETHTPAALASNLIRNVFVHWGTPFTTVNRGVFTAVKRFHEWMGQSPDDPGTTFNRAPMHPPEISLHEDRDGNPLHWILFMSALAGILWKKGRRTDWLLYAGCWIAAFLLFASYLKWQPWISRLQLPLFILGAPFCAVILGTMRPKLANCAAVIVLVAGTPWLFCNSSRPLIGKDNIFSTPADAQYFSSAKYLYYPYSEIVRFGLKNRCSKVGLDIHSDAPEYPIWAIYRRLTGSWPEIRFAKPDNVSAFSEKSPGDRNFHPCMVFHYRNGQDIGAELIGEAREGVDSPEINFQPITH